MVKRLPDTWLSITMFLNTSLFLASLCWTEFIHSGHISYFGERTCISNIEFENPTARPIDPQGESLIEPVLAVSQGLAHQTPFVLRLRFYAPDAIAFCRLLPSQRPGGGHTYTPPKRDSNPHCFYVAGQVLVWLPVLLNA
ncbi:hypothetical protein RRG08_002151 [Elysia crispata]|uniref:Uncharacterized protein n=1 Tax=Elysia crispata TaxID=231223 RepID=A0AAE0ZAV2_9GAST|nr:hypothetical protein RRG08_002151 [Elysia crispata]